MEKKPIPQKGETRGKPGKSGRCEECVYYEDDGELAGCILPLDEDEYAVYALGGERREGGCPYFRDGDEYRTVRKQM